VMLLVQPTRVAILLPLLLQTWSQGSSAGSQWLKRDHGSSWNATYQRRIATILLIPTHGEILILRLHQNCNRPGNTRMRRAGCRALAQDNAADPSPRCLLPSSAPLQHSARRHAARQILQNVWLATWVCQSRNSAVSIQRPPVANRQYAARQ